MDKMDECGHINTARCGCLPNVVLATKRLLERWSASYEEGKFQL